MTTPEEVTLAVIAKAPVAGRVKTRLCPPCSSEQAAALAAAALSDTMQAVAAAHVGRRALVLDGTPGDWFDPDFEVIAQRGDGLDERLAAAVEDVGAPLLIVGMDTPQLDAALLDGAISALCATEVDAVLGRATDGGYWTIGLRSTRPDALVGVPMSRTTTHDEQLRRLELLGLRTVALGELCDVDTFDDALEVAAVAPHGRFATAVEAVRRSSGSSVSPPTA